MTKDIINFKVEEISSFLPNCNPYQHDLYRQGVQVGDAEIMFVSEELRILVIVDRKIKICSILLKLFPIKIFVYEDISAVSKKGQKSWNQSFSPLQQGKEYFLKKLNELGKLVMVKKGHETAAERERFGYIKSKKKLSDNFFAHCIDSFILAGFGLKTPNPYLDNIKMLFVKKIPFSRRQLHKLQFNKFGKRPRYGGTVSFSMQRGSIAKCRVFGLGRIGGFRTNSNLVGFHELNSYSSSKRPSLLYSTLEFFANCNWTWRYS